MKVIVVGGGIGGIALAICLQHAGVDFVMIEKRERLDPASGASIGIQPNGARILDQMGCFDDLEKVTVTMDSSSTRRRDGTVIGSVSDTLRLLRIRTGYPVIFLDRQLLLEVLASHLVDANQVLLGREVARVEHHNEKAIVCCTNGEQVEGDVVVGADGVHSPIRHEMWRYAQAQGVGADYECDRNAMSAEYMCLYGISTSIPGMEPGETDRTYAEGRSSLSYVGKSGRIFWFIFIKMDKVYRPPDIPRFTEKDAAIVAEQVGDLPIRENGSVMVLDLYRRHEKCSLVPIEEATYQKWHYGRIVCLGDSIHKMTPNLGAGASSAIESAAVLSNVLVPLARGALHPTVDAITGVFEQYQSERERRALKGWKEFVYTHYIAPRMEDFAVEAFSDFIIGAPMVNYLPTPARSLNGTMPFNPRHGWGFKERKSRRALRATPFLVLSLLGVLSNLMFVRGTHGGLKHGAITLHPSDMQVHSDLIYGVWLLEAARSTNKGTLAQIPIVFAFASQWLGFDVISPLHFFLLYIFSPIESFRATDNCLTDSSYASTTGPTIVLFGFLPKYLHYFLKGNISSSTFDWLYKLQPCLISISQWTLAHTLIPSTFRSDRLQARRTDIPRIYFSVSLLVVAAVIFQIWSLTSCIKTGTRVTLSIHLWPNWFYWHNMATVSVWLGLAFHDLNQASMLKPDSYSQTVLQVLPWGICGPGVLLLGGWLRREAMLLCNRHEHSIVSKDLRADKKVESDKRDGNTNLAAYTQVSRVFVM